MGMPVKELASVRTETLACLDHLPRLSPLMMRLLARLTRKDCSVDELTDIVEKDPVLSGQILRLANSAIFGRLHPLGPSGMPSRWLGSVPCGNSRWDLRLRIYSRGRKWPRVFRWPGSIFTPSSRRR